MRHDTDVKNDDIGRSITVLTSLTGSRGELRDDQETTGARFVAFVDRTWDSKTWALKPAYDRFRSARRNSRAPKILAHQFVDSEFSIWIDANVALRMPAPAILDRWLGDAEIAAFIHHARTCLFDEAETCAGRNLDDPAVIRDQVVKYERLGMRRSEGLAECTVILRRHTHAVAHFNNLWWSEYCRHSVRDQISFMYSVKASGVKFSYIEPDKLKNPAFDVWHRKAEAETPA
jgi:hypothetical protein